MLVTWMATGQQVRRIDDLALRNAGKAGEDWLTYGMTPGETRYSPAKQIDAQLAIAQGFCRPGREAYRGAVEVGGGELHQAAQVACEEGGFGGDLGHFRRDRTFEPVRRWRGAFRRYTQSTASRVLVELRIYVS